MGFRGCQEDPRNVISGVINELQLRNRGSNDVSANSPFSESHDIGILRSDKTADSSEPVIAQHPLSAPLPGSVPHHDATQEETDPATQPHLGSEAPVAPAHQGSVPDHDAIQ